MMPSKPGCDSHRIAVAAERGALDSTRTGSFAAAFTKRSRASSELPLDPRFLDCEAYEKSASMLPLDSVCFLGSFREARCSRPPMRPACCWN